MLKQYFEILFSIITSRVFWYCVLWVAISYGFFSLLALFGSTYAH